MRIAVEVSSPRLEIECLPVFLMCHLHEFVMLPYCTSIAFVLVLYHNWINDNSFFKEIISFVKYMVK